MTNSYSLSASLQDYLETILELEEINDSVRVTDIATRLKIAKASVNQTINKLIEMKLVTHQIYGPIILTKSGRDVAIRVRERHKKLLKFLVEVLGVKPEIAEVDACSMEHVVSPETMDKLTDFLYKNGYLSEDNEIKIDKSK